MNNSKDRRYRLLKDLPDAKAGTILSWDGNDCYDYKSDRDITDTISWYRKDLVENNPEWFEEVKEASIQEPIKVWEDWSKDNMGVTFTFNHKVPQEKIPEIKQAIESVLNGKGEDSGVDAAYSFLKQWDKDEITLTREKLSNMMKNVWWAARTKIQGNYRYDFFDDFEKDSSFTTPQPTPTSLQEDKADWEIVSFDTYNHGDYYRKNMDGYFSGSVMRENYTQEELIKQKRNIHSVKRLSDNEVFTVGDKVGWGCTGYYESTITGFEIKEGDLKFYDENLPEGRNPCSFSGAINLHKIPTQPSSSISSKEGVLFTTLDGKDIRHGDEYWGIFINVPQKWLANKYCVSDKTTKRFSTEQAAIDFLQQKLKL